MLDIGFGAALLAGLISFVSPCVLPIVPPYLAYLAGISFQELSDETSFDRSGKVLRAAFAFVLGFTTVFVALGATASIIGQTVGVRFEQISATTQALITITAIISDPLGAGSGDVITNSAVLIHAQATAFTTTNVVSVTVGEPDVGVAPTMV